MNDKLNNNRVNSTKSMGVQMTCAHCKKNPCICSEADKDSRQKNLAKKTKRTTPPKISWI